MQKTTDPIVRFIRSYIAARGFPPTQREIAKACYLSLSAANRRILMLAAQGHIDYTPRQARGVGLP